MANRKFKGLGASSGIAIGTARVMHEEDLWVGSQKSSNPSAEQKKLSDAIGKSSLELENIANKARKDIGEEKAQIFESHILLVQDPELETKTLALINDQQQTAASAFSSVAQEFIAIFEAMDDEYMRERAADIRDISGRILGHLLGRPQVDLGILSDKVILVARDLSPSQTATMNKDAVLGFITDIGGKTSHSAIMARTLEIPAVVGTQNASMTIKDGDIIAIDGDDGIIIIAPTDEQIAALEKKRETLLAFKAEFQKYKGLSSETTDGHKVELAGNIGTPNDLAALARNDAEAVGLYRTEFVFMDRVTMPSEDEQYEAYAKVLSALGDKLCIIRTIDIGGDKKLPYLHVGEEENPFLGYRAIRICLQDHALFKTQLKALLRASIKGRLGIMFPMISSVEEIIEARAVLDKCREELSSQGIPFSKDIQVGVMIEVPSAAMLVDVMAPYIDFISIGTNDLTQYTCAVDRMNQKIEHLYNPFNPGLLRLIHHAISSAVEYGISPAMCGSMAHVPELVPFLLGSGLMEFSMSPAHILPTRKLVRSLSHKKCRALVPHVLECATAAEVKEVLGKFLKEL
jgi:phosphotransferase system enzyme I (PtsI)